MKYNLITKEEHIKILKELAVSIDKGETSFTEDEWEYIRECLIAEAMRLQFN